MIAAAVGSTLISNATGTSPSRHRLSFLSHSFSSSFKESHRTPLFSPSFPFRASHSFRVRFYTITSSRNQQLHIHDTLAQPPNYALNHLSTANPSQDFFLDHTYLLLSRQLPIHNDQRKPYKIEILPPSETMPSTKVRLKVRLLSQVMLLLFALHFVTPVDAFWRHLCFGELGTGRVDPIMAPGRPSQHAHVLFGASGKFAFDVFCISLLTLYRSQS